MEDNKDKKKINDRRKFLKLGLISGVSAVAGVSLVSGLAEDEKKVSSGEKVRVLTPDGKMVEVDA